MKCVAVVDYGMGNLRSVCKALEHVGAGAREVVASSDPAVIAVADRVVFPGQGAMRDCMDGLRRLGLVECVLDSLRAKPFLGICIGLQALMQHSEEDGGTPGLGVLPGEVRRFPDVRDPVSGERMKVPHMGWNNVRVTRPHPLWDGIADGTRFYFANSYYVDPTDTAVVAATTEYAVPFASAVARDNLFAIQFHPEKSQRAGLTLLGNFLRWEP